MFALNHDTFQRRLAANPECKVTTQVLKTCFKGTPDFDYWFEKYNTDNDLHVTVEDDNSTYTFYKIVDKDTADA